MSDAIDKSNSDIIDKMLWVGKEDFCKELMKRYPSARCIVKITGVEVLIGDNSFFIKERDTIEDSGFPLWYRAVA